MKEIQLSEIKKNTIASIDYLGRDGKVLIRKGASISDTLLSAILRRNISKLYVQEEGEDIKKLLNLQELDHFNIEDLPVYDPGDLADSGGGAPEKIVMDIKPPERVLPILLSIKRGEEGVAQFLKTESVKKLEDALATNRIALTVAPAGTPVKDIAKEIATGARSQEYKAGITTDYEHTIAEIKNLFQNIKNGRPVQAGRFTGLVKGFIKTYLNDKHMLLNLANARSVESDYIYAHSVNVCLLAISIAASRGFDQDQINDIGTGALLHDAGALLIADEIRFKQEPLTRDEIFEVQKHPMLGIHLIEKIQGLPEIAQLICYQTHERENRQGYPKQRNGHIIHDYAKIVSVADVYESLTSERPYRPSVVPYKAMEFVLKAVKQGLFSTETVKYFLEYTSLFPVGSLVKLSTGEIGKVIKPNGSLYSRPVVAVIIGADNRLLPEEEVRTLDLKGNHDIKIIQAIDNLKLNIEVMRGF
ncbi:MAG: HD domain-containing phosphohydrolase [Fibrobacterota bacterium]